MQTVLCENHFLESCLFGLSELHLALLGSSRSLPGQSWGPDGTQKTPKSDPKIEPKMAPKRDPLWGCSWTRFGVLFGAQNGVLRGAHFSSFSLFSGSFFGTPFAPTTLFLQGKTKVLGFILGPKTESSGDPFFQAFCHFQNPLRIKKCKLSCTGGSFCSPARGPKKLFFPKYVS